MAYIQTGKFKKSRLKIPKGARIIQSMLKQKVFDFLSDFVDGANVLDLFAGAGTLGFEALSRGANHVTFVDNNSSSILKIKQSIENIKNKSSYNVLNKTTLIKSDVDSWLNTLIKGKNKISGILYDVVFIDPPYKKVLGLTVEHQKRYIRKILFKVYKIISNKSVVVLKLHKKIPVTLMQGMALYKVIKQGINRVYILVQSNFSKNKNQLILGAKDFVLVGGRNITKIKKGIKKKRLNEQDYYEFIKRA